MDPVPDAAIRRIALALAAVFAYKCYAVIALAARGVSHFIDDAFYYMLIAKHFAHSAVPTFDGINATNGFHPLWMVMLAAMYRVIGVDAGPFDQLVAAKTLELATLAFALAVCIFAFARLRHWGFIGAAVVLLAPRFYFFEQGMESTLAAGLLLAAIHAILERRSGWLAAILPVLFLARLDTLVFVIAPLLAWWWLRERPPVRTAAAVAAPLAVVVAAYMGLNVALTGHPTPISGQIKSSFPAVTAHWGILIEPLILARDHGWRPLYAFPNALLPAVAIVILGAACIVRRLPDLAWLLLIALLLIANVVLFQRWDKGVEPRYVSLAYLLVGFVAFAVLPRARHAAAAFWLSLLAVAVVTVMRTQEERPMRRDMATIEYVKSITRPGERFAGTDVGAFAFWLDRPFVNLDGLVNNRALQDAIRDKRLAEYLERNQVRYLLAAFWDREQAIGSQRGERMYRSRIFPEGVAGPRYGHYDFTLYSYIHDADSERIRFCPGDEIFREAIGRDGYANAALVIYRMPRPPRLPDRADAGC